MTLHIYVILGKTLEALLHPIENFTGSVPGPWHFGTDPDPWIRILLFVSDLQDASETKFLAYFFFWRYIISFFQDKKSYRPQNSTKKVFLFFCLLMEGSGSESVTLTNGSGSGRSTKLTDPADPEHCLLVRLYCIFSFRRGTRIWIRIWFRSDVESRIRIFYVGTAWKFLCLFYGYRLVAVISVQAHKVTTAPLLATFGYRYRITGTVTILVSIPCRNSTFLE
jgi:hypothetical protein